MITTHNRMQTQAPALTRVLRSSTQPQPDARTRIIPSCTQSQPDTRIHITVATRTHERTP